MQSGQFATRLTCFALLSAIENDLRAVILDLARSTGKKTLFPPDVREKATERGIGMDLQIAQHVPDTDLLDFIDFADIAKILNGFRGSPEILSDTDIATISTGLEFLSPVRNRVCHSRPLEPDDFSQLYDFALTLSKIARATRWPAIAETLSQLKNNPSFVLELKIPDYWDDDRVTTLNNLPFPEFDDTGFLGRQKDRREVTRLISTSANPVITIVGQGGNGKTALALRCAFDVLDMKPCPFQAIIWSSLKAKVLTPEGVAYIADAVTDTFGVLRNISQVIAPPPNHSDLQATIDEIVAYMTGFPILLIIDNLETIDPATLRPLLTSVPPRSKVLLTSRIGIGELELRYPLGGFDESTATVFMRKFSTLLSLPLIAKATNETLLKYSARLFHNPLLMKWFIAAVAQGADPNVILAAGHPKLESAIKFCFENLFEKLTTEERSVLHVLGSCPRSVTNTELSYLLEGWERTDIDWALNTLHRSSMLTRIGEPGGDVQYSLTPMASQFMAMCSPPEKELFAGVRRRLNEVAYLSDKSTASAQVYSYKLDAFDASTRDDKICAAILKLALQANRKRDSAEAARLVEKAKQLRPQYADSYRISAFLQTDPFRANQEYEAAVSIAPNSARNRYAYAQFLSESLNDKLGALCQLDAALATHPPLDAPIRSLKARVLMALGRYKESMELFDAVLASPDESVRLHRIATIDQCLDCRQQYMLNLLNVIEFEECVSVCYKGFELLTGVFERSDHDDQIVGRTAKFLRTAMTCANRSKNSEFASRILGFLKMMKERVVGNALVIPGFEQFRLAFPDFHSAFDELGSFCRPGDETGTAKGELGKRLLTDSSLGKRVKGEVLKIAEGGSGLILRIEGTDLRAFLPKSQISLRPVFDLKQYRGEVMEVRILQVNPESNTTKMIVSRRNVLEAYREIAKEEFFTRASIGQEAIGVVRNVVDFGVFLDVSGVDVLMHVSSIPGGVLGELAKKYTIGDKVDVQIITVDKIAERVTVRPLRG